MKRALADIAKRAGELALSDAPFDPESLEGRDPEIIDRVLPVFESINRSWLKLRVEGVANVPTAPALIVGNHSGGIMGPDLSCTLATLWRNLPMPLYALAHDFAMRRVRPFGRVLQAGGAIRANPRCAAKALASGASVLVYPGGDLDAFRHYRHRHRVVFGPRTGFVRVAQEARVPIVPIVAAGAHESAVIIHEGEAIARILGLTKWARIERFPIALSLPWIIGVGPWIPYFPMPFPIRLRILEPIAAPPDEDPKEIRDVVVARMQSALDDMVRAR